VHRVRGFQRVLGACREDVFEWLSTLASGAFRRSYLGEGRRISALNLAFDK
jgi:hypothetical protein